MNAISNLWVNSKKWATIQAKEETRRWFQGRFYLCKCQSLLKALPISWPFNTSVNFPLILKWLYYHLSCLYKRGNECLAIHWKQWRSTVPLNSVKHLWFLCSSVYGYPGTYLISYLFNEAIYYFPDRHNQGHNTNQRWKRLKSIHQPNRSSGAVERFNYCKSGPEISLIDALALAQQSILSFWDTIWWGTILSFVLQAPSRVVILIYLPPRLANKLPPPERVPASAHAAAVRTGPLCCFRF